MKLYLKSVQNYLCGNVWFIARNVALSLSFFCLSIAAVYGQKVTLTKTNASLVEIFKDIHRQTGYGFVYTMPQISRAKKVTIKVSGKPLREVLNLCFANQPFTYTIEEKNIIVREKYTPATSEQKPNVVSGIVTDKDGNRLAGVSILVMYARYGTVTNNQGRFTIQAPAGSTLSIEMVGYQQVEIPVSTQSFINVVLQSQETALNDIVIVGYGQQKKEDVTDAVSAINSKQITEMAATNLSQVFAGRIRGVLARTANGAPGEDNATLTVRTTDNTLSPLLVVDGVPRFNISGGNQIGLNSIDPNDVESISVLKDNAATAVYGSRGANGVILVTTKRGLVGKPQVTYNTTFTWSSPTKLFTKLNSYEYAQAMNEYYVGSGFAAPYSSTLLDTIQNQSDPYVYANTDWTGMILNDKGLVQNHNLSVRGGNDAVRYYISGSYSHQGGMFSTDYFKRYILQNNLDIKLSRDFKAQVNMGYTNDYLHYPGGGSSATIMNIASGISPLTPAYMPNGSYGGTSAGTNPLAYIASASGYQYTSTNYITLNGRLTWSPAYLKGLSAYVNEDIEANFVRGKQYIVPVPTYNISTVSPTGYKQVGGTGLPKLTDNTSDAGTYTTDFAMTYNKQFGKNNIEALLLYTVAKTKSNANTDSRLNLAAPGLDILNLGSTVGETTTGTRTQYARAGYIGRIRYNYDHRLYIEGSFREDASTYFAPGHQWGFFPGGSAGWVISKENWFKPLSNTVNLLKLRASVGLTGNDNISGYTYYYTYGIANTGVKNTQGYIFGTNYTPSFYLTNSSLPNANITWSKNLQTNVGLDAVLWNGRLGATFDIYQKDRYDILMYKTYNLPATFGINGPIQNFAKARDRGFEIALNSDNKINKDWEISLNANLTYINTIWINYGTQGLPAYQSQEGHSPNSIVVYHALGLFKNQQEINNWKVDQDGLNNSTIKPGDIKYANLSGDSVLSANDQRWVNNYNFPPINFGFGFDLRYKALTLSAFFNGATGGYIQYSTSMFNTWKYLYDNSWRTTNINAIFPRLAYTANNSLPNDLNFVKDNYVRLRNLRLTYALSDKCAKAIRMKGVNIYVQASNLLTFTNVQGGIDPETPNLGTGGNSPNFYPNQRNIGFGVMANF